MQKTTVMIDEKLLKDAMAAIGARTKREAIAAGLEALVRIHQRESLARELGTYDIDLTLNDLEKMRHDD